MDRDANEAVRRAVKQMQVELRTAIDLIIVLQSRTELLLKGIKSGQLLLSDLELSSEALCGCGRSAKHSGRCWFRRGYAKAEESRAKPHQHKERLRLIVGPPEEQVNKAFEAAQAVREFASEELPEAPSTGEGGEVETLAVPPVQQDVTLNHRDSRCENAPSPVEPIDSTEIGKGMVTVSDLAEKAPSTRLAAAEEEAAKPRIEELRRAALRRQTEAASKHQELKDCRLRARGLCPRCAGPMGHSPYAACSSCMGRASQKAEAQVFSTYPD